MATFKKNVLCACCGSDVTAPQWFKGKPYGWTCITKVAPTQKRTRDTGYWVKAEEVTITHQEGGNMKVRAKYKGINFGFTGYMDSNIYKETGEFVLNEKSVSCYKDGYIRIVKTVKSLSKAGDDSLRKTCFGKVYTKDGGLYHDVRNEGLVLVDKL